MIASEREWLRDHQPHDVTLHEETTDRARAALRAHITADPRKRPKRRALARATKAAVVLATAGAVGVAVAAVLTGPHATKHSRVLGGSASPAPGALVTGHGHGPSLLRVADHLRAETETAGDATLVIRTQSYPGKTPIGGADLYTDSGKYFFAHDKDGLGAQIAAGHNQADGLFAREVAAAKDAATTNDIDAARAHGRRARSREAGPLGGHQGPKVEGWQRRRREPV